MRRILTAVLAIGSLASAADFDRTKPPETPPVPDIKLPGLERFQMPNGLTVIVSRDERFPLTTIQLSFLAGLKYDPKDAPGLSDSVAALLNQGTARRTSKQIALEAASMGAQIMATSDRDVLKLSAMCLSENLSKFLPLFADVARNASFPAEEVALRKQNGLQSLRAARSEADYVAREEMASALFGSGPYGHVGPSEPSLNRLTREELAQFRDTYLVPNNAYLVIVGRVPSNAALKKMLTEQFGSWASKSVPAQPSDAIPANRKQFILVDRAGSVQANILSGHITPAFGPDYFPLTVANRILGGGTNSRMFMDIREKRGYAYDAHSETRQMRDAGVTTVVTQVRNEVAGAAVQAVNEDLKDLVSNDVKPVELSEAKASYAGQFILNLEQQSARASQLSSIEIEKLPPDYLDTFMTHIQSVEPDQLRKAARYFSADDATVVVVGDASKIGDQLKKIGDVQVVNPQ